MWMIAIFIKTCRFSSPRITGSLSRILTLLETSASRQRRSCAALAAVSFLMGLLSTAAGGGIARARYLLNICKVKVTVPWPCRLSLILIKSKPIGRKRQGYNSKPYLPRAEFPLVYRNCQKTWLVPWVQRCS